MLEVTFSCPFCSRIFLQDAPLKPRIPRHPDPLLGVPCQASGFQVRSYLQMPNPMEPPGGGDGEVDQTSPMAAT